MPVTVGLSLAARHSTALRFQRLLLILSLILVMRMRLYATMACGSDPLSALSLKRNSSEVVCISTLAWRGTHSVQLHHLDIHIQFFFNSRVFIKE